MPCPSLCSLTTYCPPHPCHVGNAATQTWLLAPGSHWSLNDSWVRMDDSCGGGAWAVLWQVSHEWRVWRGFALTHWRPSTAVGFHVQQSACLTFASLQSSGETSPTQRAVKLRILLINVTEKYSVHTIKYTRFQCMCGWALASFYASLPTTKIET